MGVCGVGGVLIMWLAILITKGCLISLIEHMLISEVTSQQRLLTNDSRLENENHQATMTVCLCYIKRNKHTHTYTQRYIQ